MLLTLPQVRVMKNDGELDEKSWDLRETFAYFGRAFHFASVLEVGLAHALMYGEFLHAVQAQLKETKGAGFDRARYEADIDAYMQNQFDQTMGSALSKGNEEVGRKR